MGDDERFKTLGNLKEYLQDAIIFSTPESKTMFHTNLNAQMSERKITPSGLAKAIGVSKVTVYHWRKGNRLPKLRNMIKLCKLFDDEASLSKGLVSWDQLIKQTENTR
tara:strand:+ start:1652 stop:1975 length:324 start_codon:yes stop_codon:yes gene_type:complete